MTIDDFLTLLITHRHRLDWRVTSTGTIRGYFPEWPTICCCPITAVEAMQRNGRCPLPSIVAGQMVHRMGLDSDDVGEVLEAADSRHYRTREIRRHLLDALGLKEGPTP